MTRDLYSEAYRIRTVQRFIADNYRFQKMRCPIHLSIGQEFPAVAIAGALTDDDYMVSTHRGHAHYLAKGGSLDKLIAELYGKSTGCSGGHGGSMHLCDRSVNFIGSTSIVGGTIPIGVGAALSAKLDNNNRVSVVCFGDAAVEEGILHESMNYASVHKLPVIFFCENNRYSCYTHIDKRQPRIRMFRIAVAHNMNETSIQAKYEITTMANKLKKVVDHVRRTSMPHFVSIKTELLSEHCGPEYKIGLSQTMLMQRLDKEAIEREVRAAFKKAASDPLTSMKSPTELVFK